jgi:hypothetical protein
MAKLELFGATRCPYTQDLREWLEWKQGRCSCERGLTRVPPQ